MKRIDWDLVFTIAGMLMVGVCIFMMIYSIDSAEREGESFVGKQVVFNNDTLTVMNYSLMKSSYDLSNGLIIDGDLLQSLDTLTCK